MSARALVLLLVAALAAPAQAAVSPSPAPSAVCPPGIGVGLLQFPRDHADDPRVRSYVVDHVAPGATFSRRFQVCNGTGKPVTAQLYAAAATVRGGSFLVANGREANDLSRAIRIDPPTLTLAPGRPGVATATFCGPRDARQSEQYAVLWAEVPAARGAPVSAASRAGIRVYLDIAKGGEKPSDFTVDSLQAGRRDDGRPVVTAQVHNTGARALDLRGDLRLSDGPANLSSGPFPVEVGTTLGIGETAPVKVVLPKEITGGPWTARITLHSGLLERRAEGRISFPDAAGVQSPPVKAKNAPLAKDRDFLVPLAAALIFILALLLLLFWLFAKKRARRRDEDEDEQAQYTSA